jgi:hypothetical protein
VPNRHSNSSTRAQRKYLNGQGDIPCRRHRHGRPINRPGRRRSCHTTTTKLRHELEHLIPPPFLLSSSQYSARVVFPKSGVAVPIGAALFSPLLRYVSGRLGKQVRPLLSPLPYPPPLSLSSRLHCTNTGGSAPPSHRGRWSTSTRLS